MSKLLDFDGAVFLPVVTFIAAFGLCYLFRRLGWVWPPRLVMLGLVGLGLFWTVQGFQAEPDDWSGVGLIILVMFGVAPTWLGALLGADLGRRHHAKANSDIARPK